MSGLLVLWRRRVSAAEAVYFFVATTAISMQVQALDLSPCCLRLKRRLPFHAVAAETTASPEGFGKAQLTLNMHTQGSCKSVAASP